MLIHYLTVLMSSTDDNEKDTALSAFGELFPHDGDSFTSDDVVSIPVLNTLTEAAEPFMVPFNRDEFIQAVDAALIELHATV